jgi:beta-lactam-binding protein with PASTA domain
MLGDSIRRRRPGSRPGSEREEQERPARPGRARAKGGGDRFPWLTWVGIAALVLLGSFGLGYILATQLVFPRPDTAGAGVAVPSLYGLERESAQEALQRLGLEVGTITEVASLRVRAGRVVAQDPVPEQQLRPGAAVSLAVSTGPPSVRIPPVLGLPAATAQDLLTAAGFEVEVTQVRTGSVGPGLAVRTEPEGGTVVRLPATVALMVSAGPETVEPEEPADPPLDSPAPAPAPDAWP